MKGVYRADAIKHVFISSDVVPDDYVLKANETFENPSGHISPAKLVGQSWVNATDEEHEAYEKSIAQQFPSSKVNNAVPELQKMVMNQQSTITQMQKMVMTQQAEITQLKKGAN